MVPQLHSDSLISCRMSSECSSEGRSEDEETRSRLINRIVQNDTEGYSTVEAPRAEGASFSLAAHLYPDEVLDDLTISPYASFTSLSEPRPTMLSGWLDKLSPQGYVPACGVLPMGKAPLEKAGEVGMLVIRLLGQPDLLTGGPRTLLDASAVLQGSPCSHPWGRGCLSRCGVFRGTIPFPTASFLCHPNRNYVFQRRYIRFDGKNLMYFSSDKVRRGRAGRLRRAT